jgi:hypothetical protein
VKNRFEVRDDETVIYARDRSGIALVKIDTDSLPKVQAFSGTWAVHPGPKGRLYVQGKLRDPQTDDHRTVYLHRWVVDADEDTLVQPAGDALDCRRAMLRVSRKRRSYERQIDRRKTETERLQYTKALAKRLVQRTGLDQARVLRHLQRRTLDQLGPEVEEAASRLTSERQPSLPPLRVRAGWEHRIAEILGALQATDKKWLGRAEIERLFAVSRASAVKILDRFGAGFAGNALAIQRDDLIMRVKALLNDPAVSFERERYSSTLATISQDSLRDLLGEAAQQLRNNRTYIHGQDATIHKQSRFVDFPSEIDLTVSSLHIRFGGLQDFLMKIGILVYALQNDLESLERFLCSPSL